MITEATSVEMPDGGFWARQGIAAHLRWGFVALTLFMVGDGIEAGFLSPFLDERGFTAGQVSLLWGVYGLVVAVASWLAGTLGEVFGPRRVMLVGFTIWVVFEAALLYALANADYGLMLASFGVRALGYPLFAYGFLVWIAIDTPKALMGKAVGWYWFFSMLGLGVLGSYYAGLVIPMFGELFTLASSLAFVAVAGVMVAVLLKTHGRRGAERANGLRALLGAFTVLVERPRVGVGGVLRIINTLSFYAFVVFMTTHVVRDVGLPVAQWQTVWGTMLLANVGANVVFGYIGDIVGRARTVAWFGGLGCAVTVLGIYYVPWFLGANYWAIMAVSVLYGAALAGFVPLSAIMPALAPHRVGSAIAILNLGAGISQFLGPVVAGLVTPIGMTGTVWALAGVYVIGIALAHLLRDGDAGT
jgi:polyol permease family